MRTLNILKIVAAVALTLGYGAAQAATALPVGMGAAVSVSSSCTLGAGAPFAFPAYTSGQQTNSTAVSSLTANCTNLTPYSIAINGGVNMANPAPGFAGFRALSTGAPGQSLGYEIRANNVNGQQWGDGGLTINFAAYSGVGNGVAQAIPAVGIIFGGQAATGGAYSDTVVATLSY